MKNVISNSYVFGDRQAAERQLAGGFALLLVAQALALVVMIALHLSGMPDLPAILIALATAVLTLVSGHVWLMKQVSRVAESRSVSEPALSTGVYPAKIDSVEQTLTSLPKSEGLQAKDSLVPKLVAHSQTRKSLAECRDEVLVIQKDIKADIRWITKNKGKLLKMRGEIMGFKKRFVRRGAQHLIQRCDSALEKIADLTKEFNRGLENHEALMQRADNLLIAIDWSSAEVVQKAIADLLESMSLGNLPSHFNQVLSEYRSLQKKSVSITARA